MSVELKGKRVMLTAFKQPHKGALHLSTECILRQTSQRHIIGQPFDSCIHHDCNISHRVIVYFANQQSRIFIKYYCSFVLFFYSVDLQSLRSSEAFRILDRCSGSVIFNSLRCDSFSPVKSSRLWKPCMDSKELSS